MSNEIEYSNEVKIALNEIVTQLYSEKKRYTI